MGQPHLPTWIPGLVGEVTQMMTWPQSGHFSLSRWPLGMGTNS